MSYLPQGLVLAMLMGAGQPVAAMDFETPDDDAGPMVDESHGARPGEQPTLNIEVEQHELRMERPRRFGFCLGEIVPHVTHAVTAGRAVDDRLVWWVTAGAGSGRSTGQYDGEFTYSNRFHATVLDGGYAWWPSRSFPFSLGIGASLTGARGSVSAAGAAGGSYKIYTASVGPGLSLETNLESGAWIKWTLVTARYQSVLKGQYQSVAPGQMRSIEGQFSGLTVVGVANITLGYAW